MFDGVGGASLREIEDNMMQQASIVVPEEWRREAECGISETLSRMGSFVPSQDLRSQEMNLAMAA
jgi:hypothetical protein